METLCSQRKKNLPWKNGGFYCFFWFCWGRWCQMELREQGNDIPRTLQVVLDSLQRTASLCSFWGIQGRSLSILSWGWSVGKSPGVARIMVQGNWAFQGLRSRKSSGTELDVLSAVPTETLVLPGVAGEVEKGDSRWWLSTDITSCSAELVPAALTLLSSAWGHLTELSSFVAHNTQPRASIQSLLRASATTWKGQMRKPSLLW